MKPAELYILNKPEPFKSILIHVQFLIEKAVPNANLLFKWNVPFFYIDKRPFCYLNQTKDYVDLGFWNVTDLKRFQEYLISDGRKVVKSLRYRTIEDINEEVLLAVIKETYTIRNTKG
ncbi:DUF1801 domain-containing protein [Changchengzhania lutea]|uniref:DUF1801 domain-containing protein n=1 Tax=Changchengzhania lutea TaxID=2049305 RepID=UPI00115E89C0|nr:DUF1801 domain-containing protein [Changchengzhania lutea]